MRRAEAQAAPLLSARGITKSFGSVRAIDGVDLDLYAGEIHAVVGENGAGKSTLMKVLYGLHEADEGVVLVGGAPARFRSALDARRAGIGMVHQEPALAEALSAAENLAPALVGGRRFCLNGAAVAAAARRLAVDVGLDIGDPSRPVCLLPVGIRQRIEILKALAGQTRVLILDEPTAVLTPAEVRQLFHMLDRLRRRGAGALFITHKLGEVMEVSDRVTVMRRRRVVARAARKEMDERQIAEAMVGAPPPRAAEMPRPAAHPSRPRLRMRGIGARDFRGGILLRNVDFTIGRGEIFGIAGVDGNGQGELFEILAGLRRPAEGRIELDGEPIPARTPAEMMERGVGFIPPDRRRQGLVESMTVEENAVLNADLLARSAAGPFLRVASMRAAARGLIERQAIAAVHLDAPAATLSGGNQQRLVLGRTLSLKPRLLVAFNPTRGLDIAGARAVYAALRGVLEAGAAVLLISTDLDEVLSLCARVAVLYRGSLSPPLHPPFAADEIGLLMAGGEKTGIGDVGTPECSPAGHR